MTSHLSDRLYLSTFDSNPIRPTNAVVVDEEKANGDDQDTALIVIGSPRNGPRSFQTERRKESKKLASEQDDAKPEKESAASKRMDDIAFVSNDDLPDPVLYADGCVDDNKIIMLCQRQEMERL